VAQGDDNGNIGAANSGTGFDRLAGGSSLASNMGTCMKKKKYLFALITILVCHHQAFAADTSVITSVVLYPGNATIERTVKVAAGPHRLELSGLPANFDPQSVRVEADSRIHVREVSVHDVGHAQAIGDREAEIEAKIQALADQKAVLDIDAKSAELVRDYLVRLGGTPVDSGNKVQSAAVDPQSLAAVIEIVSRSGRDAFGRLQRVEAQKRELDKQIQALERDLKRIRSGTKDVRSIRITSVAERAGDLRVSYQVRGPGWRPTYRAALDSTTSRVELVRQAVITQTTGEDWKGVKLKLSTAQPRLSPQGPEPTPWMISVRPPARPRSEERADALRSQAASMPAVAELQSTFATEFEVPGTVDVPSDGRQMTVSLSKEAMAVKQRVRVAPRVDATAFVTAETERLEGIWLAGNIQLYRDGHFVGSTHWSPQSSEKFKFPFGRDDRTRVTVDRVKERSGDSGFLGNRAEREVGYTYTLTNLHKSPIEILILDSSPVSTADAIDVTTTFDPKPTAENWENKRGVKAWQRSLEPGANLKINVGYTISYPKEISVTGLP
jgi:hypothetical protein